MIDVQTDRLREVRAALLRARYAPAYNIGSPRAIDHLLMNLIAVIEAFLPEEQAKPSPNKEGE